jgi:hypothetical protein
LLVKTAQDRTIPSREPVPHPGMQELLLHAGIPLHRQTRVFHFAQTALCKSGYFDVISYKGGTKEAHDDHFKETPFSAQMQRNGRVGLDLPVLFQHREHPEGRRAARVT